MKQLIAAIVENKKISEPFYRMRIKSPYLARAARPGQFVEVKCSDAPEPLLRRPLGCHRILKDGIELLYEVVGIGTGILSKRRPGEEIDLIGPLGNGFSVSTKAAVLVAGGVGVAPLLALAEEFTQTDRKVGVVIGAKRRSHILCEREFKDLGCTVKVATEDGSKGCRGLATELLEDILATSHEPRAAIYACGPAGMLKEVARIAKEKKMPCQVSLEERMACGVGVCLGCPVKVKTAEKYKMVCKDGPVFNAEEIAW